MNDKNLNYFGNIDLKIVDMNYVLYRTYEPGYNIRIAGYVQSSMFFVTKGPLTLLVDGKTYLLNSGEIFCKDIWQPIEVKNESDDNISYFVVAFHFEKGYSFETYGLDKKLIPPNPEFFSDAFSRLFTCYEERDIAGKILQKSIIYEIFHKIIKLQYAIETNDKNELKIALAVRYINQNITKKISLSSLSETTNYSISHLRRLFYEKFGTSPLNYITERRIERAKEIIGIEDLPISQIASLCGFENTSYFIKQFKKYVGVTPKDYKSKFFK